MTAHEGPGRDTSEHLAKDAAGDPGDGSTSHLSEDAAVPAEAVDSEPDSASPATFATGGFATPGTE